MKFPVLVFLCLPTLIFGYGREIDLNEDETVEEDLAFAVETIDTEEALRELFKKHPELRERSNLFKEYVINIASARKIQEDTAKISESLDPVGSFFRKYIPIFGGTIASAINVVGRGIKTGGLVTGKIEEASNRYEIDSLKLISTDEMITRSLIEIYYNEIFPFAKKLDEKTTRRASLFNEDIKNEKSLLEFVVTVLSPNTIKNTIADLTDKTFFTDNLGERTKEVRRLQRKLKLGKLRFEFYVRILQIKAIERKIMEKQAQRSWLAHYEENPNLVVEFREEMERKPGRMEEELKKASASGNKQFKKYIMESIEQVKRQIRVNEDHFYGIELQYSIAKNLQSTGETQENLMKDMEELKNVVAPLIELNESIQKDIERLDRASQVDDLFDQMKKLEGKLANK